MLFALYIPETFVSWQIASNISNEAVYKALFRAHFSQPNHNSME